MPTVENLIKRDITDLLERTGDELGIFIKPVMYAVRTNDPDIEKEFLPPEPGHSLDTDLGKHRFYLCEGVPIDNSRIGPHFGMAFDEVRFTFLQKLKDIAERDHLDLLFPDDVIGVGCNDTKQLKQALETMKRQNSITGEVIAQDKGQHRR